MHIRTGIFCCGIASLLLLAAASLGSAQTPTNDKKVPWKPVDFAIVKLNDKAPISWNLYHTDKKGILLLHMWKRFLLVDTKEQEAYDIDPQTVVQVGKNVEWSWSNKPAEAMEAPEWKTRDVGAVQRTWFRLGKHGHILDIQIPILLNGKPAY